MGQAKRSSGAWGAPVHSKGDLVTISPRFCVRASSVVHHPNETRAAIEAFHSVRAELPFHTGTSDLPPGDGLLDEMRSIAGQASEGTVIALPESGPSAWRPTVWGEAEFRSAFVRLLGHPSRFTEVTEAQPAAILQSEATIVRAGGTPLDLDQLLSLGLSLPGGIQALGDPLTVQATSLILHQRLGGASTSRIANAYMTAITQLRRDDLARSSALACDLQTSFIISQDPSLIAGGDDEAGPTEPDAAIDPSRAYLRTLLVFRATKKFIPDGDLATSLAQATRSTLADLKVKTDRSEGRWALVDTLLGQILGEKRQGISLPAEAYSVVIARGQSDARSRIAGAIHWASSGNQIGGLNLGDERAALYDHPDGRILIHLGRERSEVFTWR